MSSKCPYGYECLHTELLQSAHLSRSTSLSCDNTCLLNAHHFGRFVLYSHPGYEQKVYCCECIDAICEHNER